MAGFTTTVLRVAQVSCKEESVKPHPREADSELDITKHYNIDCQENRKMIPLYLNVIEREIETERERVLESRGAIHSDMSIVLRTGVSSGLYPLIEMSTGVFIATMQGKQLQQSQWFGQRLHHVFSCVVQSTLAHLRARCIVSCAG